ncbi:MAG: hypothetical protein J0M10_03610 [Chitinophagales bacterium]|nr:hypothetical protein [Chitinophagales bacterium]
MVKGSYKLIFEILKDIRGISIANHPDTWSDIMKAFDHVQQSRVNGLEVIQRIEERTRLWLRVIERHEGIRGAKYTVAKTLIGHNILEVLGELLGLLYRKSLVLNLSENEKDKLWLSTIRIYVVLNRFDLYFMTDWMKTLHQELCGKLMDIQNNLYGFTTLV